MPTKKLNAREKRVCWLIAIGTLSVLALIAAIAIPITLGREAKERLRIERWRADLSEADGWVSIFRNSVIDAMSLAVGLETLVMGAMTSLPPFNGTKEERVVDQYFPRFGNVAEFFHSSKPSIAVQILAPGGVAFQTHPPTSSVKMIDLLNDYDMGEPISFDSPESPQFTLLGPLYQPIDLEGVSWQLVLRNPVYNATSPDGVIKENFWGFVCVVLNVDVMIRDAIIERNIGPKGKDFLIYTRGDTWDDIHPILFSLKDNPTMEEIEEFIATGVSRAVLRNRLSWYVCVRSNEAHTFLTKGVTAIIVVGAIAGSFILFLTGSAIVFRSQREYDGKIYAPKTAPFAMIIIGPCNAQQLWELSPDSMEKVSEKLTVLQQRIIKRYKAYEGVQLHPYSTTIITRSVETAVHICFSILEELRKHRIDGALQELLGEQYGRLDLACAVHWCTDASVRLESGSKILRYEGPDVVYCGRMWLFAAPNQVSISTSARNIAKGMKGTKISLIAKVFLRGVTEKQNLFIITTADMSTITSPSPPPLFNKELEESNDCDNGNAENGGGNMINSNNVSDGNPLSTGVEMFIHNNHHHKSVAERYRKKVRNNYCRHSSLKKKNNASDASVVVVDVAAAQGGVGLSGNTTLIELLPTDIMDTSELVDDEVTDNRNKRRSVSVDSRTKIYSKQREQDKQQQQEQQLLLLNEKDGEGSCPLPRKRSRKWFKQLGGGSHSFSGTTVPLVGDVRDDDFVAEALRHPAIPKATDTLLRTVYEQHSAFVDFNYNSVRTVIFYFFTAVKVLFKPLAMPERSNIFRRLITAFGIPQENVSEHLAVRCVLRYIQQMDEARSLLWNSEQQLRLRSMMARKKAMPTQIGSTSTILINDDSVADSSTPSCG